MMTIPNILTLSRIALIPLFVVLYYCQPTYTDTPIFTWINFSLTGVYMNETLMVERWPTVLIHSLSADTKISLEIIINAQTPIYQCVLLG
jgi:phosphatidylglycerophosphate synthase